MRARINNTATADRCLARNVGGQYVLHVWYWENSVQRIGSCSPFKLHVRDAATIARLRRRSTHLQSSRYLVKDGSLIYPVPELCAGSGFVGKVREMLLSMVGSAWIPLRYTDKILDVSAGISFSSDMPVTMM